jgi:PadR family transcriptional regulator, regulatory protein AphA
VQTTPRRTKPLTTTEGAVLGLLARAGREISGYDLKKAGDRSVGYFWAPTRSHIYAVLPRLVEAGLATRRDVAQSGKPDKQLYRITAAGRRALSTWLGESEVEVDASRNTLLLKLFFGAYTEREHLIADVREYRRSAEELLSDLDRIEAHTPPGEADFYPSLTRLYGREWARAMVRWANATERAIKERV